MTIMTKAKERLKNTAQFVTPRFIGGALLGGSYFAYSTKVALSSLSTEQIATEAGYYGVVGAAITMTLAVTSKFYTSHANRKAAAELAFEAARPEAEPAHDHRLAPVVAVDAAEPVVAAMDTAPVAPVLLSGSPTKRSSPRERVPTTVLNVSSFAGRSYNR